MSVHPDTMIRGGTAANRRAEPNPRAPVESWENEGGPPAPGPNAPLTPSDVSPVVLAGAAESGALAAMRAKFLVDFAGGTMGMHHNTYQHRSRVLRQLAAGPPR